MKFTILAIGLMMALSIQAAHAKPKCGLSGGCAEIDNSNVVPDDVQTHPGTSENKHVLGFKNQSLFETNKDVKLGEPVIGKVPGCTTQYLNKGDTFKIDNSPTITFHTTNANMPNGTAILLNTENKYGTPSTSGSNDIYSLSGPFGDAQLMQTVVVYLESTEPDAISKKVPKHYIVEIYDKSCPSLTSNNRKGPITAMQATTGGGWEPH